MSDALVWITNNAQWNNRKKLPEMWKVEQNRDSDGKLVPTKVRGEEIMSQQSSSTGERKEYLEAELHYNRSFSDHLIGGVLKYTQDKIINTTSNSDVIQGIDRRHQDWPVDSLMAGSIAILWTLIWIQWF